MICDTCGAKAQRTPICPNKRFWHFLSHLTFIEKAVSEAEADLVWKQVYQRRMEDNNKRLHLMLDGYDIRLGDLEKVLETARKVSRNNTCTCIHDNEVLKAHCDRCDLREAILAADGLPQTPSHDPHQRRADFWKGGRRG